MSRPSRLPPKIGASDNPHYAGYEVNKGQMSDQNFLLLSLINPLKQTPLWSQDPLLFKVFQVDGTNHEIFCMAAGKVSMK